MFSKKWSVSDCKITFKRKFQDSKENQEDGELSCNKYKRNFHHQEQFQNFKSHSFAPKNFNSSFNHVFRSNKFTNAPTFYGDSSQVKYQVQEPKPWRQQSKVLSGNSSVSHKQIFEQKEQFRKRRLPSKSPSQSSFFAPKSTKQVKCQLYQMSQKEKFLNQEVINDYFASIKVSITFFVDLNGFDNDQIKNEVKSHRPIFGYPQPNQISINSQNDQILFKFKKSLLIHLQKEVGHIVKERIIKKLEILQYHSDHVIANEIKILLRNLDSGIDEFNPFYERELQKYREIGRNLYFEMSSNFHQTDYSIKRAYENKANPYFWLKDFQIQKICERYINLNDCNQQIQNLNEIENELQEFTSKRKVMDGGLIIEKRKIIDQSFAKFSVDFTVLTTNKWLSTLEQAVHSIQQNEDQISQFQGCQSFYSFSVEKITPQKNLREELYNLDDLTNEEIPYKRIQPKKRNETTQTSFSQNDSLLCKRDRKYEENRYHISNQKPSEKVYYKDEKTKADKYYDGYKRQKYEDNYYQNHEYKRRSVFNRSPERRKTYYRRRESSSRSQSRRRRVRSYSSHYSRSESEQEETQKKENNMQTQCNEIKEEQVQFTEQLQKIAATQYQQQLKAFQKKQVQQNVLQCFNNDNQTRRFVDLTKNKNRFNNDQSFAKQLDL